jgi:hypothetical protein
MRPADFCVKDYDGCKTALADVGVCSVLSGDVKKSIKARNHLLTRRAKDKVAKYKHIIPDSNTVFMPLIFEANGGAVDARTPVISFRH